MELGLLLKSTGKENFELSDFNSTKSHQKEGKYQKINYYEKIAQIILNPLAQQQKQLSLIKSEISLIKVKVNKILVSNSYFKELVEKVDFDQIKQKVLKGYNAQNGIEIEELINDFQTYLNGKYANGKLKLTAIEKSSFYLSREQYKKKYPHQTKSDSQLFQEQQQSSKSDNPLNMIPPFNQQLQKTFSNIFQSNKQVQEQKKKLKRQQQLAKFAKVNIFQMVNSAFKLIEHKRNDKAIFYEQSYQVEYKRPLPIKNQVKDKMEEGQALEVNNERNFEDNQRIEARPDLNSMFRCDDSLTFSASRQGYFELTFQQPEFLQALEYLQNLAKAQKQRSLEKLKFPGRNVFYARFPLHQFIDAPFTIHQVSIELGHKILNNENEQKNVNKEQKTLLSVDLSFFCVPGDSACWGKLKLLQAAFDWTKLPSNHQNHARTNIYLKLQFPDVKERNKYLVKSQESEVKMKVLTIEHGEDPVWTEDVEIIINPQRNKVKILLVEMEQNKVDEKRVIAERTILLLEEGFLFEKLFSRKFVSLLGTYQDSPVNGKIGELIFDFAFQMTTKVETISEKTVSDKKNSFINHENTYL